MLFVIGMLPAKPAILRQFELLRRGLLVLFRGVILSLTLAADKRYYFSHRTAPLHRKTIRPPSAKIQRLFGGLIGILF
jgi:hypothetical protein